MSDASKAVFLSYASQDAEAAKHICDALRASGVEVWFDQSELVGGDSWDAKIRGQISSCALFMPVISANTQARLEGYFRLEWKLAAQRTHTMADEKAFLLPIVIDVTHDAEARVPAEFRAVQWTKLPGGETSTAFAERVKHLLASESDVGRVRRTPPPSDERSKPAGSGDPALQPKRSSSRSWLGPTILGAIVIVAVAIWQPWKNPEPTSAATSPSAAAKPATPLTEAQKLVAQARQVYEAGDELDRENIFLAEDLVKRALALDPAEPSAWEFGAWLSYNMVWQSFDTSDARRETMMRQAARARALAPQSVSTALVSANARLVASNTPFGQDQTLRAIEREMLALAERDPKNWQVQRALGTVERFLNRPDEAFAALERAVEYSGGDPMAVADLVNVLLRRRREADAEILVAKALARKPTGRLLAFDLSLKTRWHGDLAGAQRALESWPAWLLQENRGVYFAWLTWMYARQPEKALLVTQRLPREFVHDANFSGPRAVLTARAQEMAGHTEAAQADWRTVVQLCDRELAATPGDMASLYWKTWALARLNDIAGAQALGTRLQQQRGSAQSSFLRSTSLAPLWVTIGWTDLALEELKTQSTVFNDSYTVTRTMLELDSAFDPVRSDPNFQRIVAAAPAPAKAVTVTSPADDKSVAVLAFANLSDDKDNEYFSDGISEELLNVLAKVPDLKVTARTSAFSFKGKNVAIPEIARQLGVAYVIEGSVRKQGTKVRITAQLIKAADGFHVWSDTFTRELKDIFAVQDEIAALIAQSLKLNMGLVATGPRRAVNPEAHQLVLEGRYFWNLRTLGGFDRAEAAFTKAIALDPQFAQAYAGLADVRWTRSVFESYAGANLRSSAGAREATERALALDPMLAEAYPAAGAVLHWSGRLGEAEQQFKKAIALNPNYALAHHWYSLVLEGQGRLDEALAESEQAIQLDPLSVAALSTRHRYLLMAGRISEALVADEKVVALRPDFFFGTGLRAQGLLAAGQRDEAMTAARSIVANQSLDLRWISDASAVYVLRALGREAEAVAHVEKLLPRLPADSYLRGLALAALDRWDEAIPYLERTPPGLFSIYFWNPLWDRWRDDPRFGRLLATLNCVEEYKVARATLARMRKEQAAKK